MGKGMGQYPRDWLTITTSISSMAKGFSQRTTRPRQMRSGEEQFMHRPVCTQGVFFSSRLAFIGAAMFRARQRAAS